MLFSDSMKKTEEFRNCYENGKSYANKFVVVYVWKNGGSNNKVGISCSKKIGNSVVRHRFARLVREAYRLHENIFNSGLDIVVVARACARDANFFDIEECNSVIEVLKTKGNGGKMVGLKYNSENKTYDEAKRNRNINDNRKVRR